MTSIPSEFITWDAAVDFLIIGIIISVVLLLSKE